MGVWGGAHKALCESGKVVTSECAWICRLLLKSGTEDRSNYSEDVYKVVKCMFFFNKSQFDVKAALVRPLEKLENVHLLEAPRRLVHFFLPFLSRI